MFSLIKSSEMCSEPLTVTKEKRCIKSNNKNTSLALF